MKTTMKTCSRGHRFKGPGPCPICWPGGAKRRAAKKIAAKKKTATKSAKKTAYKNVVKVTDFDRKKRAR